MGHCDIRRRSSSESAYSYCPVTLVYYLEFWPIADNLESWSGDGRYLLSAARDWKCVLWDLKDGSRLRTVILDGPIWGADLHPHDQYIYLRVTAELVFALLRPY